MKSATRRLPGNSTQNELKSLDQGLLSLEWLLHKVTIFRSLFYFCYIFVFFFFFFLFHKRHKQSIHLAACMLRPVQCSLRKCIAEGTADAEIKGKPKLKSIASPIYRNGMESKQNRQHFFPHWICRWNTTASANMCQAACTSDVKKTQSWNA